MNCTIKISLHSFPLMLKKNREQQEKIKSPEYITKCKKILYIFPLQKISLFRFPAQPWMQQCIS